MGGGLRKATILVVAYCTLLAIPRLVPSIGDKPVLYGLAGSIPVVLVALLGAGVWGMAGLVWARLRSRPAVPRHRELVFLGGSGLVSLAVVLAIPRALPAGSYFSDFDPVAWQDPDASVGPVGGFTPRQEMLGDVVDHVLPGKTRAELEAVLGPTEDSGYFASTGRDLIYRLGMERGSFFRIDSEWLLVWLDDSGHYQRFLVASD